MRYKRHGPEVAPTSVDVYMNSVRQGSLALSWSGADLAAITFYPAGSSEWVTVDGSGNPIEASWGLDPCDMQDAPGEDDPGDGPIEGPGEGSICDGQTLLGGGDDWNDEDPCAYERQQFVRSAMVFAGVGTGSGAVAWVARRALERVWPPLVMASMVSAVYAGVDGLIWANCVRMN